MKVRCNGNWLKAIDSLGYINIRNYLGGTKEYVLTFFKGQLYPRYHLQITQESPTELRMGLHVDFEKSKHDHKIIAGIKPTFSGDCLEVKKEIGRILRAINKA